MSRNKFQCTTTVIIVDYIIKNIADLSMTPWTSNFKSLMLAGIVLGKNVQLPTSEVILCGLARSEKSVDFRDPSAVSHQISSIPI